MKKAMLCMLLLYVAGCSSKGASTPPDPQATLKTALLQDLAECTLDRTLAFQTTANNLLSASTTLVNNNTLSNLQAAQQAWEQAMAVWQELELFQFGPAGNSTTQKGGQNIRDYIYAWPTFNRCTIEETLVKQTYSDAGFANTLITARGLAAFEFLAFYQGTDNACPSTSKINTEGTWAAMTPEELTQRKHAYMNAIANDIAQKTTALAQAWQANTSNFRSSFLVPGSSNPFFSSYQEALNAINTALFYIDTQTKDFKLGRPLGRTNCLTTRCPETVESPYSNTSIAHIRANLKGFRRIFQGCKNNSEGVGFDDLLKALGHNNLSENMLTALTNTETALNNIASPLQTVVTNNPAQAEAVYSAVKTLTDALKTETVSALNLRIPSSAEGDND